MRLLHNILYFCDQKMRKILSEKNLLWFSNEVHAHAPAWVNVWILFCTSELVRYKTKLSLLLLSFELLSKHEKVNLPESNQAVF